MGKVVHFPVESPPKCGPKRASSRRAASMEEMGQMTIFDQMQDGVPIISLSEKKNLFEKALMLDEQGDPNAEQYYLLAVDHNQSVENAYCNLGILKAGANDSVEAVHFLTKCLEVNPRHFEAHYNLGNVYADLGNLSLSRIHYELALKINPEDSNTHYNLALVYISMKKYQQAIEYINRFVSLAPSDESKSANELLKTLNAIAQ